MNFITILCIFVTIDVSTAKQFHKVVGTDMTWFQARDACVNIGMRLANIRSTAENTAAAALVSANTWIGFSEQTLDVYFGTDNVNMGYTNFDTDEPNNSGGNEACIEMYTTGKWNDHFCATHLLQAALCETIYKKGTTEVTWVTAKGNCEASGMRLANPRSAKEALAVRAVHASVGNQAVPSWTGYNDLTTEGAFFGTDNAAMSYVDFWGTNTPDNFNNEDCVVINPTGANDLDCTVLRTYVCEEVCSVVEFNGVCECTSGLSGFDCAENDIGSCTLTSVQNNVEVVTATLPSVSVANNNLVLTVRSPYQTGRYVSAISVSPPSTAHSANCDYPGANWVKDGLPCTDELTGTLPWSMISSPTSATGCKFQRTNGYTNPSDSKKYTRLQSDVRVSVRDVIGSLRGVQQFRDSTENFHVQVLLPESVSAQTNINVHAAIVIDSAIVSSIVNVPATGNPNAVIVWRTAVQSPFTLSVTFPAQNGFTNAVSSTACSMSGNICTQDHTLTLTVPTASIGTLCSLDQTASLYDLDISVACVSGTAACPLDSATNTADADLTLVSENFCAVTSVTTGVTATLTARQTNSLTGPVKTAWLPGQTAYFTMQVDSPQAPMASITPVSFMYDRVVGGPLVAFPGGSYSSTPASCTSCNTLTAKFQFPVTVGTGTQLWNIAADGILEGVRIQVACDIVYTTGVRRRALLEVGSVEGTSVVGISGPASAGAAEGAAAPTNAAAGSSASGSALVGVVSGVGAAVVLALVAVIAVGVLVIRRRGAAAAPAAAPAKEAEEAQMEDVEAQKFASTEDDNSEEVDA